jgi:hypothetical protein
VVSECGNRIVLISKSKLINSQEMTTTPLNTLEFERGGLPKYLFLHHPTVTVEWDTEIMICCCCFTGVSAPFTDSRMYFLRDEKGEFKTSYTLRDSSSGDDLLGTSMRWLAEKGYTIEGRVPCTTQHTYVKNDSYGRAMNTRVLSLECVCNRYVKK